MMIISEDALLAIPAVMCAWRFWRFTLLAKSRSGLQRFPIRRCAAWISTDCLEVIVEEIKNGDVECTAVEEACDLRRVGNKGNEEGRACRPAGTSGTV